MLEAGLWGLAAASSLVVGAGAGLALHLPRRLVALGIGFGAGALVSAMAFDLTAEAFATGGAVPLVIGLAAGSLTFFAGNQLIHRRGGGRRGQRVRHAREETGPAIVLGAVLDGIPESVVLGSTLLGGGTFGIAFFAAVLISNVPEAFTAAVDLRREGHRPAWILRLWVGVALVSGLAAAIGYWALEGMTPGAIPIIQAFAAGAILTMLVDTMIPEAYGDGGDVAGIATVLGFAAAFLISAAN
ncbi:MAG TPA: ZIP family zinc transporter [Candidatus Limnocylindria bacterium]|nr:ZIP family zinc transporter [Candidatus Limnocylindria bacterium]